MKSMDFVEDAPCRGADPWLFDQSQIALAIIGLQYCIECPFKQECLELVAPSKNYFDGICGGIVWQNGRVLAKLDTEVKNRLIIGGSDDTENDDAVAVRGSKLLGSGHGDVLP